MNEFFLEKIVKLKNDNATVNQNDATDVLGNFLSDKDIPNDGFDLKELSEEDVLKLIKNIKGKKSCGLDWICGHSQKIVAKDLVPDLRELINITNRKGRFTPRWKIAKICQLSKTKAIDLI